MRTEFWARTSQGPVDVMTIDMPVPPRLGEWVTINHVSRRVYEVRWDMDERVVVVHLAG